MRRSQLEKLALKSFMESVKESFDIDKELSEDELKRFEEDLEWEIDGYVEEHIAYKNIDIDDLVMEIFMNFEFDEDFDDLEED